MVGPVDEFVVYGCFEISEEVLGSMPMLRAWVVVEATKDPNRESNVWAVVN